MIVVADTQAHSYMGDTDICPTLVGIMGPGWGGHVPMIFEPIILDDLYEREGGRFICLIQAFHIEKPLAYMEIAPTLRAERVELEIIEKANNKALTQRLEPKEGEITNTLTKVAKDNMILVRQASKSGYAECNIGGVADLSYPDSKTRRGRVIENGKITPTIQASSPNISKIEQYRIRRLTPLECYRLMGVTDEDAKKMLAVNSNTQCYKQAGNSIVVDVMVAMFKNLFYGPGATEPKHNEQLTLFNCEGHL